MKATARVMSNAINVVLQLAYVGLMASAPLSTAAETQFSEDSHRSRWYLCIPLSSARTAICLPRGMKTERSSRGMRKRVRMLPPSSHLRLIPMEKVYIRSLAFSPDGRTLATGNTGSISSGVIRLWDVTSGKNSATFNGSTELGQIGISGIYSVQFSPDGKILASGHEDNLIRIWNAASGSISTTFEADADDRIYSVAFSHQGKTLASGGKSGTIKLWDVARGKSTATFKAVSSGNCVYSIAFSPDGRTLGAGCWLEGGGMLWDVARGKNTAKFKPVPADSTAAEGVNDMAYSVAFSPDGKTFAVGCSNGIIGLWNIPTGKKVAILHGHTALVRSLDFHPDGKTLASGSDDSTVRLWSVN